MKTLITAIVLALTATTASSTEIAEDFYQEGIYEYFADIHDQAMFCSSYGEELANYHLEDMVDAVGEDATEALLALTEVNTTMAIDNYAEVVIYKTTGMNKLWQKRFDNYYYDSIFEIMDLSVEYVEEDLNTLGMEKLVEKFMLNCRERR